MERNTIISVKNLVKNYGNFEAVKGISFDVFENEIFGMLGPNGAGKSTTLEINYNQANREAVCCACLCREEA